MAAPWAALYSSTLNIFQIEFDVMVRPTALNIYETFNPGAVVSIKAQNALGNWVILWSASRPIHLHESRIFSPSLRVSWKGSIFKQCISKLHNFRMLTYYATGTFFIFILSLCHYEWNNTDPVKTHFGKSFSFIITAKAYIFKCVSHWF